MKYTTTQLALLLFVLFIAPAVHAQDKGAKKIKKLYETGKYKKCIKKSEKSINKDSKNVAAYFFKSLSYFNLIPDSKSDREALRNLRNSIRSLEKANKYCGDLLCFDEYKEQLDSIQSYTWKVADSLFLKDKGKARYYYDKLAGVFHDTSEFYYVFHTDIRNEVKNRTGDKHRHSHENLEEQRRMMLTKSSSLVGVRYVYGGEDTTGFDCSGFTQYAYSQIGIELPHNAQMQSQIGLTLRVEDALPGDLIFFGYKRDDGSYRAVHAGMVYDNQNGEIDLIHCVSGGVNIHNSENTNNQYWLKQALFVKRIIGELPDESISQIEE